MTRYLLTGASSLLILSAPAAATTFTVGLGTDQVLVPENDFKTPLENLGLDVLRTMATLTLTGPAKIKVELMGSESTVIDRLIMGSFQYDQGPDVDNFGAPVTIANLTYTNPASFSIGFSSSLTGFMTVHAPGSEEVGFFIPSQPASAAFRSFAAGSYTSNVLYIGYDNGPSALNDNDHDDLVIRLTATAVPEPATWALLIAGFGLVGAAARRYRFAVSYT